MAIRLPKDTINLVKGLALPWLFKQLGVGKFLRERLLHVPQAALHDVALAAGVTGVQWRAVEAAQADLAEGKITSVTF